MIGAVPVLGREKPQKQFQEDEATEVILLTIAVGGISLNLTAASHVIHCDRCYRPAKEQQANDRAHRIGQHHSVCVHTLMTSGTIEERFDASMKEKTELSNLGMTSAEDWITSYSAFGSLLLSSGAYFCLVELISINSMLISVMHSLCNHPRREF